MALNKHMDIHHTGKEKCEYIISHFRGYRQSRNSAIGFIEFFNNWLSLNLIYLVFETRKHLDNCKKKNSKRIVLLCQDRPPEIKYDPKFQQWYSYVLRYI